MSNIRITKQFSFETGHALYGYDGKCKNVHGHSYKLSVTVIGSPITDRSNVKFGMVIDFTDLKKIVKEEIVDQFDHATVFNGTMPHVELANELMSRGHHVILVDYQPTSENMVVDFSQRIISRLPDNQKVIVNRLKPLAEVGLGYIKLGQNSSSLSGGENQRVKLAYFIGQEKQEQTMFIFDEPTTGLHFHDIQRLLSAFNALIERGHTVLVIEHNLDVIKCADYVIDLGPDGGNKGGNLVCEGTPEDIAACKESITGKFLKDKL